MAGMRTRFSSATARCPRQINPIDRRSTSSGVSMRDPVVLSSTKSTGEPGDHVLVGRREGQRSVRSVDVVMIHENGEDALKMLLVQDQQPIEVLRANGAHEPLCAPPTSRQLAPS